MERKMRKQQAFKAWAIFKHNCPVSKGNMMRRLREKAAHVAFNLSEDVFTIEQSDDELAYIGKTNKSDYRRKRKLIRRGENRGEMELRDLRRYLKKDYETFLYEKRTEKRNGGSSNVIIKDVTMQTGGKNERKQSY